MGKPIVITCANHKGGSGKTSMSGSLISALAEMGYKVLGIDGDMQRNLTTTFGLDKGEQGKNLYQAIEDIDQKEDYRGADYITRTAYENVDFIVSHENMALMENILMLKQVARDRYVSDLVNSIKETEDYDFIIFDTNPTLGILNMNIFISSDYILIPVECTAFGVDGLGAIVKFLKGTKRANKELKIAGIVMQKVDNRKNIVKDALEVVEDQFGEIVFETMVHVDSSVEKSQWEGVPLLEHSPKSRAAMEYRSLAKEVVEIATEKELAQ